MDESAFKSLLEGLDAQSQSLHGWLTLWTWLVVVGVFFEIVFIIWSHVEEHGDWLHAKTHGVISPPSKPSIIRLVCELLSVVLVVAGVSGELVIDAKLGQTETRIRDVNEKRTLQLQKEAGDAKKSAADAAKAAGDAQASADKAGKDAKDAKKGVDLIRAEAEALNQETAELRAKIKFVGPRNAYLDDPDLMKKLEATLRPFSGSNGEIRYASSASNNGLNLPTEWETLEFANALREKLNGFGWKFPPAMTCGSQFEGVEVVISPRASEVARRAATAMVRALSGPPFSPPGSKGWKRFKSMELKPCARPMDFSPPGTWKYFDDETIVIEVGRHP